MGTTNKLTTSKFLNIYVFLLSNSDFPLSVVMFIKTTFSVVLNGKLTLYVSSFIALLKLEKMAGPR